MYLVKDVILFLRYFVFKVERYANDITYMVKTLTQHFNSSVNSGNMETWKLVSGILMIFF